MGFFAGGVPLSHAGFDDQIYEFFREAGGSHLMNVDGSVTPVVFEWENAAVGRNAVIGRTLWDILDAAPTATKFGGIVGGLANGFLIELVDAADVVQLDFLDGGTIKQNHEFGRLAGTDWLLTAGQGLDSISIRWSLFKAGKELRVPPGFKFRVTVRDDLTDLDSMTIMAQGYLA